MDYPYEMNTSIDKQLNKRSSDRNEANRSIDLSVSPFGQSESINDECGLFDDDNDEDNLTLLDLKSKENISTNRNLNVFDELNEQCEIVLKSTSNKNYPKMAQSNLTNLESILSNHMNNDYEKRFQESLLKLIVPSWFTEHRPISKKSVKSRKQTINNENYQIQNRAPEIIQVRRPQMTRSCRSSLASSPSPSLHSWHPKQMIDGMNFPPLSSTSINRRSEKYEKAIDRVAKSSHWYQPSQFFNDKNNKQISVCSIPSTKMSNKNQEQQINGINKISIIVDDADKLLLENEETFQTNLKNKRLTEFNAIDDVNEKMINGQKNDRHRSTTIGDKLDEESKLFDESQLMSLESEKMLLNRVEVEEITDDEESDKLSFREKISTGTVGQNVNENSNEVVLERLAKDLVDSLFVDVFKSKHFVEDSNIGVRELSDDEDQLRELDENEMNETDEFIVFPTQIESQDENQKESNEDQQQTRSSLNRLYTFSKINEESTNAGKIQDSLTSDLIITDKDLLTTTETIRDPVDSQPMNNEQTTPIYRSHIQKRNINLGRYYDGMMRASHSQLPTHDLRPNLVKKSPIPIFDESKPSEGITEETVRKGRLLLDSIPNSIDVKLENNPNREHQTSPVRSILKNARFLTTEQTEERKDNNETYDRTIIENPKDRRTESPRRIVTTTVTEEYRRVQRQIIEEFDQEVPRQEYSRITNVNDQLVSPSVHQADSSIYESLSKCYSGYNRPFVSDFISRPTEKLTSHVSSILSTSDEAYESDPTHSGRSTTNSASIDARTSYVHPDLIHEFDYPSPPPPVPDRNLKPNHLRSPPPVKPRTKKSKTVDFNSSSSGQRPISSQLNIVQTIVSSASESSSSVRSMSSRHYCGTLPAEKEKEKIKSDDRSRNKTNVDQDKDKRYSTILSCLNPNEMENSTQEIIFSKSLVTKSKSKRIDPDSLDEPTNGLAIRLKSSNENLRDSPEKFNQSRDSTNKQKSVVDQNNGDRLSIFETSV